MCMQVSVYALFGLQRLKLLDKAVSSAHLPCLMYFQSSEKVASGSCEWHWTPVGGPDACALFSEVAGGMTSAPPVLSPPRAALQPLRRGSRACFDAD